MAKNVIRHIIDERINDLNKERYVSENPDKLPILVQIYGRAGRNTDNEFNTQVVGGSGKSGDYQVLQMVVFEYEPLPLFSIGRTPNNAIHLHNSAVSKFHASIRKLDGVYFLHDENSKEGTAVIDYANKIKFKQTPDKDIRTPLCKGEKVRLEDRMVLEFGGVEFGTRLLYLADAGSQYDYLSDQFNEGKSKDNAEASKPQGAEGLLERVKSMLRPKRA